jgi:hypothetical protein
MKHPTLLVMTQVAGADGSPRSEFSNEHSSASLDLDTCVKAYAYLGSTPMRNDKIRVGIIVAGGWAKYGHIPALQILDEFEIVAVSSRKQETADEAARLFNIPHASGDEQALIDILMWTS